MRSGTVKKMEFENLRQLPRDKQILDFIRDKLLTPENKERKEIVTELFEMHRTSEGFDPMSLCKARVSRVKSTVIKKILADVDAEVGAILQSIEFKEFISKGDSSARLFNLLQLIRGKIQRNDFNEVEKLIAELKELISLCSKQDLLIALYKIFNSKTRDRSPEPEIFLRNIKT
jgi:hypothetical protein